MSRAATQQRLSVCLIVRNESRMLADCLQSIKPVADQIVVVDTGSTDDTVEIARKYGAEVFFYQWEDDFATARNYSLKPARGEWILWLDADERLSPESQQVLPQLLARSPVNCYYRVTIRNLTKEPGNYLLSTAHRLLPNRQGFRFVGKIHEIVVPPAGKRAYRELPAPIVLEHLGYALTGEIARVKEQRNRQLLEKVLAADPEDVLANFNYAQHLDIHGSWQEARIFYQKTLNLGRLKPVWQALLLNNLASLAIKLQDYPAAKTYAEASIKCEPLQSGAYYHLYRRAYFLQDSEEMIHWLQQLLSIQEQINARSPRLPSDLQLDTRQIQYTLAQLLYNKRQWAESRRLLEAVLAQRPTDQTVLNHLVDIAIQQADYPAAQEYLNRLVTLRAPDTRTRKLQAILAIKQRQFTQAIEIYERVLAEEPHDQEVIRRLVGLYGTVGNLERARQLSAQLNR